MFASTLVMTLVSDVRSAGQRERCGQKNCKTLNLSAVEHECRYVDMLYTHTCAVTKCSFVCAFGSSYRVSETFCVHPFTSSLFSQHKVYAPEECDDFGSPRHCSEKGFEKLSKIEDYD